MQYFIMLMILIGTATQAEPTKEEFPRTVLEGIEVPRLGEVGLFYPIESSEFYVIDSPGGVIDTAFASGQRLQGKTCIVKMAASAALQILLPYCKHRYYLPDTTVQFHSAHQGITAFGMVVFSMWDAEEMHDTLRALNLKMIQHMVASGFPLSPKEILQHSKEETLWRADDLGKLGSWIRPIKECKHCPPAWRNIGAPPAPKKKPAGKEFPRRP